MCLKVAKDFSSQFVSGLLHHFSINKFELFRDIGWPSYNFWTHHGGLLLLPATARQCAHYILRPGKWISRLRLDGLGGLPGKTSYRFQSTLFSKLCAFIAPSLVSWLQMSHQTALLEETLARSWSALGRLAKTKLWWKFRRTLWPAHFYNTPRLYWLRLKQICLNPIYKGTNYQLELATLRCWSKCLLKEAKTTVDTEKSTWQKLLDEFEEEGHSDLHINSHDHHKTSGAETGGDSSHPMPSLS